MGLERGQFVKHVQTGITARVIREWFNEWADQWRANVLPVGAARGDWQIWCDGDFVPLDLPVS